MWLLGRVRGGGKGIAVVKWRDGRGPVGHAIAAGAGGVAAPAHAARVKPLGAGERASHESIKMQRVNSGNKVT